MSPLNVTVHVSKNIFIYTPPHVDISEPNGTKNAERGTKIRFAHTSDTRFVENTQKNENLREK